MQRLGGHFGFGNGFLNLALRTGIAAALACLGVSAADRPISPLLFGQNLWLDIDSEPPRPGYVHKLWNKVEQSGVRIIRIGGANYDGNYPSKQAYLAWVDSVKRIGAEPLVQVSRRVTDRAGKAADLVRFLNVESKRSVKYWSIGNEPGLHEKTSAAQIAQYTREISVAMRDVDAGIRIYMGEMAWYSEEYCAAWLGGDQDVSGKDPKGRYYVDLVSYHTYLHAKAYSRDDVVLADGRRLREQFTKLSAQVAAANTRQKRIGAEALGWALTEFNITYDHPENHEADGLGVASFLNGQLWAEVFGLGMELGAHSVIPWCIHEYDAARLSTDFGYIGPAPGFPPRPNYYHMQLMTGSMTGGFVPSISRMKRVKIIATRSAPEGGIAVLILNQSQSGIPAFRIELAGGPAPGDSLTGSVDAGIKAVVGVPLKPETTYMLIFDAKGKEVKRAEYGLSHALRNAPPVWENASLAILPSVSAAGPRAAQTLSSIRGVLGFAVPEGASSSGIVDGAGRSLAE